MERDQITTKAKLLIKEHYPQGLGEEASPVTTDQLTEIINQFSGFDLKSLETYQILQDLNYSPRKIGKELFWMIKVK